MTQPPDPAPASRLALVTGVTGYIGTRLVRSLLHAGWQVRVLTRNASTLSVQPWDGEVDVVEGDAQDTEVLARALDGTDVAYYLLHSMDGRGGYRRRDRELAEGFARASEAAGVGRIVYLGGLHPQGVRLSEHLASRTEVGEVFLGSAVPAAVLQAAVILGTGSASFEMLRHLTTRLPAMIAPKWLNSSIQPIAVADVLDRLVVAASLPTAVNRTFDVGGPDVLTYREMIQAFADVAGLRPRLILSVPVLTPHLASYWVGFVTPVPTGVAQPLVGSLVHDVVCLENDLEAVDPDRLGHPLGVTESITRALRDAEAGNLDPAVRWPADPSWVGASR